MRFSNKFVEMFKTKGGVSLRQTDYASILIALLIIGILVLLFLLIYYLRKKYNFSEHKNFNSLAENAGLSSFEAKTLYVLLKKFNVKNPLTCFTNAKLLDEVLKKGINEIHFDKFLKSEEKEEKIATLINIKIKIENSSRKNIGIRSTHFISENQKIIVFIRDKGYFYATVKRNLRDFLLIEFISVLITKRILTKEEYIKIYFWRHEDAGYIFESQVLDYGDNIRSYKIKHSNNLIRSQKRKYKRVPVNVVANFTPLAKKQNNKYQILHEKTQECCILDLSAGGIRFIADKIDENFKFYKVDFKLKEKPVSFFGKIIRIEKKERNSYEVRLQIIKISLVSKNLINSYIYNYLPSTL